MNTNNKPFDLTSFNHLLKAKEVAEILNINRSFAYHLMQTGDLPVVRLGKACRVRPEDLMAFIQKNRHSSLDNS